LSKLSDIKAFLQSRKLRVTHSRLAVATILIRNESSFFTPEEIYTRIVNSKKLSCDQVSVYRVLSTFEELGLVSKNVFQGEAARYKYTGLAKQGQHNHQHFFKCNVCDVIEALEGCFVRKKERELTQLLVVPVQAAYRFTSLSLLQSTCINNIVSTNRLLSCSRCNYLTLSIS